MLSLFVVAVVVGVFLVVAVGFVCFVAVDDNIVVVLVMLLLLFLLLLLLLS